MWFNLIRQDEGVGPISLFSSHHSEQAAEKARAIALKDPYWRLFTYRIIPTPFKPRDGCCIENYLDELSNILTPSASGGSDNA